MFAVIVDDVIEELHLAIRLGQYDKATHLCRLVENPDSASTNFAILLLSQNRDESKMVSLLSELVKYGHDINAVDHRQCNALFDAIHQPLFIDKLIEYGINVNQQDAFQRNALFHAVYGHHIQSTKSLLNAGSDLNATDMYQHTPLMLACCFGNVEMVELLVEYGANTEVILHSKHRQMNPLALSIQHVNFEIAAFLVQNGADLDIRISDEETIWDFFDPNWSLRYWNPMEIIGYTDLECDERDSSNEGHLTDELMTYSLKWKLPLESGDKRIRRSIARVRQSNLKKEAQCLVVYMEIVETERIMKTLKQTTLVLEANIPMDILYLIANPVAWY